MTKYFSYPLLRDALRRTRVFGIIIAVFTALSAFSEPFFLLFTALIMRDETAYVTTITPSQLLSPLYYIFILAVPFVIRSFSFLFARASSDYYLSLPYTRQSLFFSTVLADICWLVGIAIVSALLRMIYYAVNPYTVFSLPYTLLGLLVAIVSIVELISLAALASSACGTRFSAYFSFLLISFDLRIVLTIFVRRLGDLVPILDTRRGIWQKMTFRGFLPVSFATSDGIISLLFSGESNFFDLSLLLWAIFVIAFALCLGCFVFLHRPGQTAGTSTAFRSFQHIFRSLAAIPFLCASAGAFVTVFLPSDSNNKLTDAIVLFVLSVLSYFAAELVTTGKIKYCGKMMKVFSFVLCVPIVFSLVLVSLRSIYLSKDLKRDDIRGVLLDNESSLFNRTFEDLITADVAFDDPGLLDMITTAYQRSIDACRNNIGLYNDDMPYAFGDENYQQNTVCIRLSNNRAIYRKLLMTEEEMQEMALVGMASDQYSRLRLSLPPEQSISYVSTYTVHSFSLSSMELWRVFCEEYQTLSFEDKCMVKQWNNRTNDVVFSLQVTGIYQQKVYISTYDVPYFMEKTVNAYISLVNTQIVPSVGGEKTSLSLMSDMISSINEAGSVKDYDCTLAFSLRVPESDEINYYYMIYNDAKYGDGDAELSEKDKEWLSVATQALSSTQAQEPVTPSSCVLQIHTWYYMDDGFFDVLVCVGIAAEDAAELIMLLND